MRHLLVAALLAGVAAGLVATAIQSVTLAPLITAAEAFEVEHPAGGQEHSPSQFERTAHALLFNALAGIGFGALLCAAYNMTARVSAVTGALWGAGGFIAFFLAPALGLPPSLPGTELADLGARQAWWLGTAGSTAAGLLLVVLARKSWQKALGALLIVAPHVIGAPQPPAGASGPPEDMARAFALWSALAAAAFWLALGGLSGWLVGRRARPSAENG
jgi:cobalt transporter subunit CbtA